MRTFPTIQTINREEKTSQLNDCVCALTHIYVCFGCNLTDLACRPQ